MARRRTKTFRTTDNPVLFPLVEDLARQLGVQLVCACDEVNCLCSIGRKVDVTVPENIKLYPIQSDLHRPAS